MIDPAIQLHFVRFMFGTFTCRIVKFTAWSVCALYLKDDAISFTSISFWIYHLVYA